MGCNFLSNPLKVHTTYLLDFMVEYQLAQFIKEPAELMPKRILVLMYLLHVHPGGDTHIKVKGMLIVSLSRLSGVNCRFWCHLELFSTLYLLIKVSLMAVHQ